MPTQIAKTYQARGLQRVGRYPIAASQTFKAGDFLSLNSSGQAQILVAAGNGSSTNGQAPVWSSGTANLILGRAVEDAQPVANDPTIIPTTKQYVEVILAEPGTQFEIPIYHATPASAFGALTLLGQGYELWNLTNAATFASAANLNSITGLSSYTAGVVAPASAWYVRIDKTTNIVGQIVDFVPEENIGGSGSAGPNWPDIGQNGIATNSAVNIYGRCWYEFLGGATVVSGARPLTRTN